MYTGCSALVPDATLSGTASWSIRVLTPFEYSALLLAHLGRPRRLRFVPARERVDLAKAGQMPGLALALSDLVVERSQLKPSYLLLLPRGATSTL
jgi:hypothetical protein